jgi:hypothetical protein
MGLGAALQGGMHQATLEVRAHLEMRLRLSTSGFLILFFIKVSC